MHRNVTHGSKGDSSKHIVTNDLQQRTCQGDKATADETEGNCTSEKTHQPKSVKPVHPHREGG